MAKFHYEETDCLRFYGMLSLHELFEVVGSQLTEMDIEVLSFILDEGYPGEHPLNPSAWTVEPCEGQSGVSPEPELLKVWGRLPAQGPVCPHAARHKPKTGLLLLLELERNGYLSEGNLEPLLQLLRILTRHDLLHLVSHKKRGTVSPERLRADYGTGTPESMGHSELTATSVQTDRPQSCSSSLQFRRGGGLVGPTPKKRRKAGHGWSRPTPRRRAEVAEVLPQPPPPPPPAPEKVTCNVRLRVRAEYREHEAVLREGVHSDKREPVERQFELFSRASALLRARDLGTVVCEIKFSDLDKLEAFWGDYLSGALLEALKGVFITDALRMAAGWEGVRLLINVDQDDYERGRGQLMEAELPVASVRREGQRS